jgi:hypothetical protein
LKSTRKADCGASQLVTRLAVRAAPFALLEELAQDGVRRESVPDLAVRAAPFALLEELAQNGVRRDSS